MVEDGAFSLKIDYVLIFFEVLNLEGHLNRFIGSKVTAILVNGKILPRDGVALGRVCACSLRSRLVKKKKGIFFGCLYPLANTVLHTQEL